MLKGLSFGIDVLAKFFEGLNLYLVVWAYGKSKEGAKGINALFLANLNKISRFSVERAFFSTRARWTWGSLWPSHKFILTYLLICE